MPSRVCGRQSNAERRAGMTEQILDAAEQLFAERGYYGVTLLEVAQKISVHPTLLYYYYKDKRHLFCEVFARRAQISSSLRAKALQDYELAAEGKPTVVGALRAFLDADLDQYIGGGEGWRNFARLSGQIVNTPEWGAQLMELHFDPIARRLIGLLQRTLPESSLTDIFWGYHFLAGSLMHALSHTGRIDRLSRGRCNGEDFVSIKRRMADFMSAGLLAVTTPNTSEPREIRKISSDAGFLSP
jgi:AcrR family transcriptional regulator